MLSLLFALLVAAPARADGVRFDEIPADATGYAYMDVDRFLASDLVRETDPSKRLAANATAQFGGHIASIVMYTLPEGDATAPVLLVHGEEKVLRRIQTKTDGSDVIVVVLRQIQKKTDGGDVIVVDHDHQEVHYSTMSPAIRAAFGFSKSLQKAAPSDAPPPTHRAMLSLGFGGGSGADDKWVADDVCTAIVGSDLLVGTTNLRSMALALDVLAGRKASLAKSDPHDLKGNVPAGAFICGTGLTANVQTASTTQPADIVNPDSGNIGLSMFGSLRGKARLARFDMGEDERCVYIHASVAMLDEDSAGQLKNLVTGIKALIALSQTKEAPLLDPLEIQAAGKNVLLQWTWPTAKLPELVRLVKAQGNHDTGMSESGSATAPSAAPVR